MLRHISLALHGQTKKIVLIARRIRVVESVVITRKKFGILPKESDVQKFDALQELHLVLLFQLGII